MAAARAKLTNSSDESEIVGMLSGDLVYEVPYFQRPYKWKLDKLRKLEENILDIVDELIDSHFLGAIIMHGRKSNPSEPTSYELIDGQQRLTTIFLYICASIKVLCKEKEYDEAVSLFQKYICLGRATKLFSNVKLHSCGQDRGQMNSVMSDLCSDVEFLSKLGSFKPQPLPTTSGPTGILLRNYKSAVRFLDGQIKEGGVERVRSIYDALLSKMSVVQIDVWDPTNGPKIFDSLNSQQEPMTIGDLVRNDIFSRVSGGEPSTIEAVDRDNWQPFYQKFQHDQKNYFEDYFFPFGLIENPNLTKSRAYDYLRSRWETIADPVEVVKDLSVYQNAFLGIVTGQNHQGHPPKLATAIGRLSKLKAPTSILPFFMRLSEEARKGSLDPEVATAITSLVEGFLVRRALSGFAPTGLHAVFKRLWADCGESVTTSSVAAAIRAHTTVAWPSDEQVREAVKERAAYGSQILPFVIREYDKSLGGDTPENIPWIEHVLPQTLNSEWKSIFSESEHKRWLHVLANLLPLSSEMNVGVSNKAYVHKRQKFEEDSMFKSARKFAREYVSWTPVELKARSEEMAKWVVETWPG
ncbi:MAG: DUF262 domain-containing HNH endonuclease family protein [Caulobacter sp.]|nr:DUF262 domain-containing HNH endonuclease family protein [Caulobacter sp.]